MRTYPSGSVLGVGKIGGARTVALGVTAALLFACVTVVVSAQPAPTRKVLLRLDANLKDPSLDFVLDDREITAQSLQAPMALRHGNHELLVLRQGKLVELLQFEIGPTTPAELTLKQKDPPPGPDEPDFRPSNVAPTTPTPLSRDELRRRGEWVPLFNGKDRSGWRSLPKVTGKWQVENGILVESGIFGPLFTVEDDWTDVHLHLEAKITAGGSGVCLRAPLESKPGRDSCVVYIGGKMGTGSFRIDGGELVQNKNKLVPPDTWFTMDVILRGNHTLVKVDDRVVIDHRDKENKIVKGHISLLPMFAKAGAIHYRRIMVRDLAPERLLPKDKKDDFPPEKIAPRTANYLKYTVHTVPLSDKLAGRSRVMMAHSAGAGFRMGWNAKGAAHITPMNEDLKRTGPDIVLPDRELRALAVHDDGTMVALVLQPPVEIDAVGLDAAGRVLFKTPLTGANGNGPGTHFASRWFNYAEIESTGKEFAVHFAHEVHLKGGAKHQGGYFARLDQKGTKLQENQWTVSHSLDQALLYHRGDWFTASVGDAFPFGIPFINRSQKKARSLIYPAKDHREGFKPKRTRLADLVGIGNEVGLAFVTFGGETWHTFYALMDRTGEVKRLVNLPTKIPPTTHASANLARFGGDMLLIWTETDATTAYVPIDSAGRFLAQPTLVDVPAGRRNDLALFANGDVGWLDVTRGRNEVTLVRVKR